MRIKDRFLGVITASLDKVSDWPIIKTGHGVDRLNRIFARYQGIEFDDMTAYHEAGHALLQYLLLPSHPPRKATIIETLGAAGYMEPNRTKSYSGAAHEKTNDIVMKYGGYCAEKIVFGDVTDGCSSDIENIKQIARSMVQNWDMGGITVPKANFDCQTENIKILGLPVWTRTTLSKKPLSPDMQLAIEQAQVKLMTRARNMAYQLLQENRPALDALAQALIEKRTLIEPEIKQIIEAHTDQRPDIRTDYALELDQI